jgi:hypothetical protein
MVALAFLVDLTRLKLSVKVSFVTSRNLDRSSVNTSKFAVVGLFGLGNKLINVYRKGYDVKC